jgi:bifunctional non-homologous end joining protein LigD
VTTIAGVSLSNPDRVLYPEQGITKEDLARYYEAIAPLMLPHLAGRPFSLVRCPSGRQKACFYQKHWTGRPPAGVRTVKIRETRGDVRDYTWVESAQGLVALVQNGVLEFHVWGSRVDRIEHPDRLVFDMDPAPDVPWPRVREAAREMRERLRKAGLESWLKTTGGKGLHVVVPIDRRGDWKDVSAFARTLADRMSADSPARYLARASKAERKGKIFVDWLRNTRGATWIAAWSTRARPGAPLSVPISWEELGRVRRGDQFTIENVAHLVGRRPADPWAAMAGVRQRLPKQHI